MQCLGFWVRSQSACADGSWSSSLLLLAFGAFVVGLGLRYRAPCSVLVCPVPCLGYLRGALVSTLAWVPNSAVRAVWASVRVQSAHATVDN